MTCVTGRELRNLYLWNGKVQASIVADASCDPPILFFLQLLFGLYIFFSFIEKKNKRGSSGFFLQGINSNDLVVTREL